jgi:hypothetical protein
MSSHLIGGVIGADAQEGGGRPGHLTCGPSPPGGDLPESSRIFFFIVWSASLYVNLTCGPPLVIS